MTQDAERDWRLLHEIADKYHGNMCLCDECEPRWRAFGLIPLVEQLRDFNAWEQQRDAELAAMSYADYLLTSEWDFLRACARDIHGHRCQLCNSTERLNVHHRRYPQRGREDPRHDLTVLCRDCHATFHENRELAR